MSGKYIEAKKTLAEGLKRCGDNPDLKNLLAEVEPLAKAAEDAIRASMTGPVSVLFTPMTLLILYSRGHNFFAVHL
mgnify:CR=1 FL=1